MQRVASIIKETNPGTFVHSVYLNEDLQKDQNAGYFGYVNDQVEFVCQQISSIPELSQGFDAMGFSQGGLFLRAYAQRCNQPPVRNLVTWGSPHYGISDLPPCSADDFVCQQVHRVIKFGVYSGWARKNIVQAQYYRNPEEYDKYLEYNDFLADINNEYADKNRTYSKNIASLDRFVMIVFRNDTMLVPKESSWFQSYDVKTGKLLPVKYTQMYRQDWLGLKALDSKAGLEFVGFPGDHMRFADKDLVDVIERYFRPANEGVSYGEDDDRDRLEKSDPARRKESNGQRVFLI
ncbi:Palmitoyl-protein thioesterase 1 [Neolecta irregularis DAH-3]|uniref:Palmitoyl-protein thioesterase 1 n=1 Tax=Neolecta irregularis (strain DAH-3) TaxID=1198029 RepID=A0A1U7LKX8_NEOID|nr:Palmitoyl-protein thioesterase 1 [Neolecta irregularis DAH-3]|eukprot:OLL23316.1 Palmitoyl-protein thioesterase 1 [Neolecta irregularis DAH-3]